VYCEKEQSTSVRLLKAFYPCETNSLHNIGTSTAEYTKILHYLKSWASFHQTSLKSILIIAYLIALSLLAVSTAARESIIHVKTLGADHADGLH